jgi:hypothetical protein
MSGDRDDGIDQVDQPRSVLFRDRKACIAAEERVLERVEQRDQSQMVDTERTLYRIRDDRSSRRAPVPARDPA